MLSGALLPFFLLRPAMRSAVIGETGIVLGASNFESLVAKGLSMRIEVGILKAERPLARSPHDPMSPIRNERPSPLRLSDEPSESVAHMSRHASSSL